MTHEMTVTYNEEVIEKATKYFWKKYCGRELKWGVLILAASIIMWSIFNIHEWYVTTLMALSIIFFVVIFSAYFVYKRRVLHILNSMEKPSAIWKFSEKSFSMESDVGRAEYKWGVLHKVWRFPEVWLLFFSNQNYSTLPTATLSPQVESFIVEKLKSENIKIT